jgi:O-acetylserine/cysteine efflux transporter
MKFTDILLAFLVALIWGVSSSVAKIGINNFPPFLLMFLRFAICAIIVLPFLKKPKIGWIKLATISVLWVGYHGLAILVIKRGLPISSLIVIQQINVALTALAGYFFLNERLSKLQILGIVICFTGIFIIFGSPSINGHLTTFIILLISILSWVAYNVRTKFLSKEDLFNFSGWVFVISVPIFLILSLYLENISIDLIIQMSTATMFSIIFLSIVTTLIAFGLWIYLLKHYPITIVAHILPLKVVMGIASGVLMFYEKLTTIIIIGAIIIIIGVIMILPNKLKN